MKKIFSLDSPVILFMTKLGNMILIDFLWLICSLPVVTFGASTSAMYRAMFDLREDKGGVVKAFFKAFVGDFKLGTLCWLTLIVCGFLIYCIPQIAAMLGLSLIVVVVIAATCALILVLWLLLVCIFPLVAYFDNTLKKTLRNAAFIAVKHRRQSIISALVAAVPVVFLMIAPYLFVQLSGLWLLIYPGVTAYFIAGRFAPIFLEYGNKRDENKKSEEEV